MAQMPLVVLVCGPKSTKLQYDQCTVATFTSLSSSDVCIPLKTCIIIKTDSMYSFMAVLKPI